MTATPSTRRSLATCEVGTFAVSGGCQSECGTIKSSIPFTVTHGSPGSSAVGWECEFSENTLIRAYALCCDGIRPHTAATIPSTIHSAAISQNNERNRIKGQITFEYRTGYIPSTNQSISYWSAMMHDAQGTKYELPEVFGIDQERTPASVQLSGTEIHDRDTIVLSGNFQKLTHDFGLVSDIKTIQLVH
jgi:hypothetical protein